MLHLIYASNHVEINILFSLPGWNFSLEFATFWCGKASAINHPQKRGWVLGPIFGMICNSNLAGQLRSMVHWCSLLGLLHYIVSVNPKIRSFWNIQNSSNFHQTFIKHMKKRQIHQNSGGEIPRCFPWKMVMFSHVLCTRWAPRRHKSSGSISPSSSGEAGSTAYGVRSEDRAFRLFVGRCSWES